MSLQVWRTQRIQDLAASLVEAAGRITKPQPKPQPEPQVQARSEAQPQPKAEAIEEKGQQQGTYQRIESEDTGERERFRKYLFNNLLCYEMQEMGLVE